MSATHMVTHPFDANGRTLEIGEWVDASQWKNTEKLVGVKYLRTLTPADLAGGPPPQRPAKRKLAPAVDTPARKKFTVKKR